MPVSKPNPTNSSINTHNNSLHNDGIQYKSKTLHPLLVQRYRYCYLAMMAWIGFLVISTIFDMGILNQLYRGSYSGKHIEQSRERFYQRMVRQYILPSSPLSSTRMKDKAFNKGNGISDYFEGLAYTFGLQSWVGLPNVPVATSEDNWQLTSQLLDSKYRTFDEYLAEIKRQNAFFSVLIIAPKHETIIDKTNIAIEISGLAVAGIGAPDESRANDVFENERAASYSRHVLYSARLDGIEFIPLQNTSKVMDGPFTLNADLAAYFDSLEIGPHVLEVDVSLGESIFDLPEYKKLHHTVASHFYFLPRPLVMANSESSSFRATEYNPNLNNQASAAFGRAVGQTPVLDSSMSTLPGTGSGRLQSQTSGFSPQNSQPAQGPTQDSLLQRLREQQQKWKQQQAQSGQQSPVEVPPTINSQLDQIGGRSVELDSASRNNDISQPSPEPQPNSNHYSDNSRSNIISTKIGTSGIQVMVGGENLDGISSRSRIDESQQPIPPRQEQPLSKMEQLRALQKKQQAIRQQKQDQHFQSQQPSQYQQQQPQHPGEHVSPNGIAITYYPGLHRTMDGNIVGALTEIRGKVLGRYYLALDSDYSAILQFDGQQFDVTLSTKQSVEQLLLKRHETVTPNAELPFSIEIEGLERGQHKFQLFLIHRAGNKVDEKGQTVAAIESATEEILFTI